MDLIKLRSFLHSKGNHQQNKNTNFGMGENIANDMTNKGLISKVYKQLIQLNIKQTQKPKPKNHLIKNGQKREFPGSPVVKNLPSNAGDVGLIPGEGTKVPHAMGQLSPCTTPTELVCPSERAHVPQTTESMHSGVCVPQLERSLHATRKSLRRNGRSHTPQ